MEKQSLFAIVDVETTGGSVFDERITEIAIYKFDGRDIVDKMVSLVNPERKIQDFVVKLTGITDEMVLRAPKFHEIAKRVHEITEDCTFVAHNADFDYRVIRKEFKRLGFDFNRNTLCTVQLSKKLIPDMPSYSLGKLCRAIGLPISNRHRADGDAFATVKLFELLLQKDTEKNIISDSVTDFDVILKKEKIKNAVEQVPASTGVFYIHQSNGRIMYIGKGKNMNTMLRNLIAKKSKKAEIIISRMSKVSFDETGSYVMARLKFNQEVDIHKPRFNSNFIENNPTEFNHPDMILVAEGRTESEKSIIVIEQGKLKSYGYAELEHQINHIDILNNLLIPLTDSQDNRYIVKSSIMKNRVQRIIRL